MTTYLRRILPKRLWQFPVAVRGGKGADQGRSRLTAVETHSVNGALGIREVLVDSRPGRALLHLGCMLRGGRIRWHAQGILRELRQAVTREAN